METTIRSGPTRMLLAAALLCSLTLGVAFVVVHRLYDLRGIAAAASPMSDEQSRRQVVEPARQFVSAGSLRVASGTYVLQSCSDEGRPPYRGQAYLTFEVPTMAKMRVMFADLADAMTARGWKVGTPPGHHPEGWTLAKDGVIAVYYRHPDIPDRGVLKIDGECRDLTDHQQDSTAFVDIIGDLNR
jgi:hypothetical protein